MINWSNMKSDGLKNLWIAFDGDNKALGMVHQVNVVMDDKSAKQIWRTYSGIGDNAQFLGLFEDKKEAMNRVEKSVDQTKKN